VSQRNSHNDRSSSTQSTTIAPLHYVTHKNHRDQEVGVDHIFIRPMNCHNPRYKNTDTTPNNDNVSDNNNNINNKNITLLNNNNNNNDNNSHNVGSTNSIKSSTTTTTSRNTVIDSSYQLFINTSEVLPSHLSCHYWRNDFHISDHRPIKTNIIITNE